MLQVNPGSLLFGFLWLLIIFLHPFQEAVFGLRVLDMFNLHVSSLGKNLALNLLVCNDAHSMLGNAVDSSSFDMVTHMGHFFMNSAQSHDVNNTTLIVDSRACGKRNKAVIPTRPREEIPSVPPLPLCDCRQKHSFTYILGAVEAVKKPQLIGAP